MSIGGSPSACAQARSNLSRSRGSRGKLDSAVSSAVYASCHRTPEPKKIDCTQPPNGVDAMTVISRTKATSHHRWVDEAALRNGGAASLRPNLFAVGMAPFLDTVCRRSMPLECD